MLIRLPHHTPGSNITLMTLLVLCIYNGSWVVCTVLIKLVIVCKIDGPSAKH